ncbi:UDP-N-acetylmuramoyl-tripeptide--D-alanyl-D-alanine ligase [Candidatus Azambacteria bacterium]|nr:UDP-N-acetylmuramoyl-tripeptide--D-alanyl-D-alanine ligase [Candidatus Azambacteria bacterium]
MKKILQLFLALLARLMLRRYTPTIICITGNVGKTSTKEAVFAVVGSSFSARKSEKNYNNEIGVPLTILGIHSGGKSVFAWAIQCVRACGKLVWTRYPQVLVIEMAVDRPGDMEYLLSIVTPTIAVFTSMGEMPVHVENFVSAQSMIREKVKLAHAVEKNGFVIVNEDVLAWREIKTKGTLVRYGTAPYADVKIHTPEYRFSVGDEGSPAPIGITFKMEYKGSLVPFRLDGVFGMASGTYAAAAACAVGMALEMNLVEVAGALQNYTPPNGRLKLIEGIRGSFILDDTYNASPSSMDVALETLYALPAERKIAVLGDMLELGKFTEEAHRTVGRKAASACSVLVTVGERMRLAADEAKAHGFVENENLFSFDTAEDAGKFMAGIIQAKDLVMVKGSQSMRMEYVVKEIMAHPERAEELLVRQDKKWLQS